MKRLILLVFFFALYSGAISAQPSNGNPGGSPTPFGFIEILAVAGAAYGGKKVYDKKKKDSLE